ncbi:molybdate ABC transporter substrate-binding protein [Ottowia thiooxydans]|uniref:molybdate ABC transporter substrate-binding protein n=1 Tax=Ottowia thiooxydans TaxID=219182 RepID=UPI00041DC1ED|nr:molybdate ABC transporter substrate-binding protein [Ottowia thiooxydans]
MDDSVQLFSAGSLRHAIPEITEAFTQATGIHVSVVLGPAGLLRERIEAGERFDLFTSANMAHPQRLVDSGLVEEAVCFARNRLCVLTRAGFGLGSENFVDVLSDPAISVGISTPKDDPSGDYAFEMFDLLGERHPGLAQALKARALQLVGGRHSPVGKSAVDLITEGAADLFIGYATYSHLYETNPAVSMVELPAEFSPKIKYGLALREGAPQTTRTLRDFILSEPGQAILQRNGFLSAKPGALYPATSQNRSKR